MTTPTFAAQLRSAVTLIWLWSLAKWSALVVLVLIFGFQLIFGNHKDPLLQSLLIGIPLILAALAGGYVLLQRASALRKSDTHPLTRELTAQPGKPITDSELDASFAGSAFHQARLNVSPQFVVYAGKGRLMVRRTDTLVWVYTERVTHKLNGVIPYRTSHHLTLWDETERGFTFPGRQAELTTAMQEVATRAPWLPAGFTEVLNNSWNADRAEFIAYVAHQRQTART